MRNGWLTRVAVKKAKTRATVGKLWAFAPVALKSNWGGVQVRETTLSSFVSACMKQSATWT